MRAQEFIVESADLALMPEQQIVSVAQDAFARLYPGVKLYGKSTVEGVGLSTQKGGAGSASAFVGGETVRGEFYLTLNAYAEGSEMIVVIEDATAGKYKGATTAIINSLFASGERLYKTKTRSLVVNSNANQEAWDKIANRVGAELNEDLNEGWRETLAALGIAGAAAGGVALDDYVSPQPAPQVAQASTAVSKPTAPQQYQQPQQQLSPKDIMMATAKRAGIVGNELAALMAQTAHETLNFTRMREVGTPEYFAKKYENKRKAKILGNKVRGDGERYKGRGFIQLTGRDNYKRAGTALGLPLEANPELAADPNVAAKVAVWYWQNRVAPKVQDFTNTRAVTKKINPGMKHAKQRQQQFKKYQVAMR